MNNSLMKEGQPQYMPVHREAPGFSVASLFSSCASVRGNLMSAGIGRLLSYILAITPLCACNRLYYWG